LSKNFTLDIAEGLVRIATARRRAERRLLIRCWLHIWKCGVATFLQGGFIDAVAARCYTGMSGFLTGSRGGQREKFW